MDHASSTNQGAAGAPDSELTAEQLDRLRHCISEADKAWDDRFDFRAPKLLERYMRGELCFHFHFRDRMCEPDAQDFCATFYGLDALSRPVPGKNLNLMRFDLLSLKIDSIFDRCTAGYDQQQLMFISVVEVLQDSQSAVDRVSCKIGLHTLNDCLGCTGDALYFSPSTGGFEFLGRGADGKLYPRCGVGVSLERERPDQVIQTGAEVMDNLPCNNGEIHRRLSRAKRGIDILRKIRIELANDFVRLKPQEVGNVSFKVLDVMVGPINLRPTPVKWM